MAPMTIQARIDWGASIKVSPIDYRLGLRAHTRTSAKDLKFESPAKQGNLRSGKVWAIAARLRPAATTRLTAANAQRRRPAAIPRLRGRPDPAPCARCSAASGA